MTPFESAQKHQDLSLHTLNITTLVSHLSMLVAKSPSAENGLLRSNQQRLYFLLQQSAPITSGSITKKNKLVDALELFEQLVNLPELRHTSFVLFLNKIDVFKEKIRRTPLTVCPALKEYEGNERDLNAATRYIEGKFLEKNKDSKREVFSHITCAIDQKNVRKIFEGVIETVIGNALTAGGLIG
mmetsp:Transcript_1173/g.1646  ORF Transcript_1173/g.1646 Transcript_1173/m.1646 type:complete len:185 (+) Transcript_1173:487-1041(+)